jgi:tetratricopeptide (TPR) repeat protein
VLLSIFLSFQIAIAADVDSELARAKAAGADEAVALLRELRQKNPQNLQVASELAVALYRAGKFDEAAALFQELLPKSAEPAPVYTRLGKCLSKLGKYKEAEAAYRAALEKQADLASARCGLATVLYQQKRLDEGLPIFDQLAQRDDEWGETGLEYAAQIRFEQGHFQEVIDRLSPVLAKKPDAHTLRWLLARSLYNLGRFKEAQEHFALLRENPAHEGLARFYCGGCLEGLGRCWEAEQEYRGISQGSSAYARAARLAADQLCGRPFRFALDVAGGYDTSITVPDNRILVVGGQGYFSQVFGAAEGRVYRREEFSLWLGGEIFGLQYPDFHKADFQQESGRITFQLPKVGPFEIGIKEQFEASQLGYDPYRHTHRQLLTATWHDAAQRLCFGLGSSESQYSGRYQAVSGLETTAFADYTRLLPFWSHEFRLRGSYDPRMSDGDTYDRIMWHIRGTYRAKVYEDLWIQTEGGYRFEDYHHDIVRPTIRRLHAEARLEYPVQKHLSVNAGWRYERQESELVVQNYRRHIISAGMTLSW